MPHPFDSGADLSLRHLPDVSDASFSFQLPSTASGDLLLADDDADFFHNEDMSLTTPPANRTTHEPLTLSQLTPKPKLTAPDLATPSRRHRIPTPNLDRDFKGKQRAEIQDAGITAPAAKDITAGKQDLFGGGASPVAARFKSLKAEVEMLTHDTMRKGSPSSVHQRLVAGPAPAITKHVTGAAAKQSGGRPPDERTLAPKSRSKLKSKRTVIAGGISKTRLAVSTSNKRVFVSGHPVPPQNPAPSHAPSHDPYSENTHEEQQQLTDPDISICSTVGNAVAERLVMYSHQLLDSYRLFNSESIATTSADGPDCDSPMATFDDATTINAITHADPVTTNASATTSATTAGHADSDDSSLTLSQISPRKRAAPTPTLLNIFPTSMASTSTSPAPSAPAMAPASPMQPSSKRPGRPTADALVRKKGKINTVFTGVVERRLVAYAMAPKYYVRDHGHGGGDSGMTAGAAGSTLTSASISMSTSTSTRKRPGIVSTSSLTQSRSDSGPLSVSARARQKAKGKGKFARPGQTWTRAPTRQAPASNRNIGDGSGNSNSQTDASSPGTWASDTIRTNTGAGTSTGTSATVGSLIEPEPRVQIMHHGDGRNKAFCSTIVSGTGAPANPTKPVGFRFDVDVRMDARKIEVEKERADALQDLKPKPHPHPGVTIPDFKALHAAQEAELALRKGGIVPVVPLPLELNTDVRAREREKFEARMREREREMERAMEERRREREEEEEREIRELRRRAVPRAHEVPEWYRLAPRKKGDGGSSGG